MLLVMAGSQADAHLEQRAPIRSERPVRESVLMSPHSLCGVPEYTRPFRGKLEQFQTPSGDELQSHPINWHSLSLALNEVLNSLRLTFIEYHPRLGSTCSSAWVLTELKSHGKVSPHLNAPPSSTSFSIPRTILTTMAATLSPFTGEWTAESNFVSHAAVSAPVNRKLEPLGRHFLAHARRVRPRSSPLTSHLHPPTSCSL